MKSKAPLRIVRETHRPVVMDITALLRADIAKKDWDAVQVAGDRREPVDLPETRLRRLWR